MKIGIIGEFDIAKETHLKTNDAISHCSKHLNLSYDWIDTGSTSLDAWVESNPYSGFLIAPGSPYDNMVNVLNVIKFCRENDLPTLGTCGGCQHMLIEYARNKLNIKDANHAEYDPYASNLFITPLSCSLVGIKLPIKLQEASKVAKFYGKIDIEEKYYCNFGLNPKHQNDLHDGGLRVSGIDHDNEARVFEIPELRFFVATLFVPQALSTQMAPHPLISAFIQECSKTEL